MSAERHKIESHEVQGLKMFKKLSSFLERLHDAGCQRDRAHNRLLHMDQYVMLLLLYMFNPICVSLRALQQASELKNVQKALGCPRASLGSLSEAATIFDSELLIQIIGELAEKLRPIPHDARLDDLGQILTAVDGSVIPAFPKLVKALWKNEKCKGVKAHIEFEILKGVPVSAVITDDFASERKVLASKLQAGRFYVIDRGYMQYRLFQAIIDTGSSFAARLSDNVVYETVQENILSDADRETGVVRDMIVRLGGDGKNEDIKQHVRIVEIKCEPHRKRAHTGRGGPEQGETIQVATNRMDLPAEVIAIIFKHRWTVEIFFRFFKHILGCRHLISHKQNGIELQTYAAIIACMLISLWTNRKPTLRTYEMFCYYIMGWAGEDELLAHIARLQKIS